MFQFSAFVQNNNVELENFLIWRDWLIGHIVLDCGKKEYQREHKKKNWLNKQQTNKYSVIQILPVNDTSVTLTWRDSYPYSAISVFALHPQYINLNRLTKNPAILTEIEQTAQKLYALDEVDYEHVMRFKLTKLEQIFKEVLFFE